MVGEFIRFIFEPRPGYGDVQWLDWDPEAQVFCGGSFEADFFEKDILLGGFCVEEDLGALSDEELEGVEIYCPCVFESEGPGVAVGYSMLLVVGSGEEERLMQSPARIASVQEIVADD